MSSDRSESAKYAAPYLPADISKRWGVSQENRANIDKYRTHRDMVRTRTGFVKKKVMYHGEE